MSAFVLQRENKRRLCKKSFEKRGITNKKFMRSFALLLVVAYIDFVMCSFISGVAYSAFGKYASFPSGFYHSAFCLLFKGVVVYICRYVWNSGIVSRL